MVTVEARSHQEILKPRQLVSRLLLILPLTLSACGPGTFLQDSVLGSRVLSAKPIPSFTIPERREGVSYLQFFVLGDIGTGRAGQQGVAVSLGHVAAQDSVSFVILLGDNFYPSGVQSVKDNQWEKKFEAVYSSPSLQIPFYAVLGNHDYLGNPDAQVEYTKKGQRWTMPSRYYTFSRALDETTIVDFFCLDTTPLNTDRQQHENGPLSDGSVQITWLESQLSKSRARWKIVLGHHTLYSGGPRGDNKKLILRLGPLFERYGVDLYIAGHDHHLETKKPIKGVHYVISGGGATHRRVTWMENTLYAATNMGFNRFRISRDDLVTEFFDKDGILRYAHTITKK